jgi:hypothetical protein
MHNMASTRAMRAAVLAALCTAVNGCASKPPPPQPAAVAPLPPPDSPDGEYRGTSTRFQAGNRACPHPGLVTLVVIDNAFQFRWDRDTWVDATIAADGSITGQAEGITLVGRQSGRKIAGDVTNGTCGLHFTVAKWP